MFRVQLGAASAEMIGSSTAAAKIDFMLGEKLPGRRRELIPAPVPSASSGDTVSPVAFPIFSEESIPPVAWDDDVVNPAWTAGSTAGFGGTASAGPDMIDTGEKQSFFFCYGSN